MNQNKVLFIGLVWPEPTSSAAGKRIVQLVEFFINRGDEVTFCSAATQSESSFDFSIFPNVKEIPVELNHSSFNEFIRKFQPEIVVYDRYISEEQFGWRVRQECPKALQILDTEDLHFLRSAREKSFKRKENINLFNEIALREIASILRCDLSLLISEFEMNLLQNRFQISPTILHYLPFLEEVSTEKIRPFNERNDFVFIGNFIHEPNWQTVLKLKKAIWPKLKKAIPTAKLHIYGAYASQKVWDLHNEKNGFLIHGKAKSATEVISHAKILLAPIPFGAGQKGKFIDAMQTGTPIATNSIGAESMFDEQIPGIVADDENELISKTVELYSNETVWNNAQKIGFEILHSKFDKDLFIPAFDLKIKTLQTNLANHRNQNFIGQILQQNANNSLKYMSLWIEQKNKIN